MKGDTTMYSADYLKFHTEKKNTMDNLDELLKDAPVWDWIAERFPKSPDTAKDGIWYDGDEFLCRTDAQVEGIADWMANVAGLETATGYYDPEEDQRNGETDQRTGWYYARVV